MEVSDLTRIAKTGFSHLRGFTLAELMMVVGVIAIVAVIGVPVFVGQLKSNRKSADRAFYNAAVAAAVSSYYSSGLNCEVAYYYDASTGQIIKTSDNMVLPAGYGLSTSLDWKNDIFDIGALTNDSTFGYPNNGEAGRFVVVIFKDNKGNIDHDMTGWVKKAVASPYTNAG